ncbi:DUF397 domain-containing protein [Streptomyces zagrosensis]|uniref:DUF397 domain-containing protein n=1 Tax=Streptomyces zagrosensis TaxID=1042984 RepID=A0A7W9QGV0_9ACTN|nr:DUF397 domain-containing protein [Streptomyces zagrosensis]MBB5939891.1 hypothetical protein [Streptomyces zagrosensis]
MMIPDTLWVKSSYSGMENACVEWAPIHAATNGTVPVRDSKDPHGPALAFTTSAWSAFLAGVKADEFGV